MIPSAVPEGLKVRVAFAFWLGLWAVACLVFGLVFQQQVLFLGVLALPAGKLAWSNRVALRQHPPGIHHRLNQASLGFGGLAALGAASYALFFILSLVGIALGGGR